MGRSHLVRQRPPERGGQLCREGHHAELGAPRTDGGKGGSEGFSRSLSKGGERPTLQPFLGKHPTPDFLGIFWGLHASIMMIRELLQDLVGLIKQGIARCWVVWVFCGMLRNTLI